EGGAEAVHEHDVADLARVGIADHGVLLGLECWHPCYPPVTSPVPPAAARRPASIGGPSIAQWWRRSSSLAGQPGRSSASRLRTRTADSRPPAATVTAQITIAVRNPSAKRAGCWYAAPVMPAATGRTATASSPAPRDS